MKPEPVTTTPPPSAPDGAAAILPYRRPPRRDPRTPSPLAATLLCLPGVACWGLLGSLVIAILNEGFPVLLPPAPVLYSLWFCAVVTAVASFGQYWRVRRKPWYVLLCLWVNGAGLAFTVLVAWLTLVEVVN